MLQRGVMFNNSFAGFRKSRMGALLGLASLLLGTTSAGSLVRWKGKSKMG